MSAKDRGAGKTAGSKRGSEKSGKAKAGAGKRPWRLSLVCYVDHGKVRQFAFTRTQIALVGVVLVGVIGWNALSIVLIGDVLADIDRYTQAHKATLRAIYSYQTEHEDPMDRLYFSQTLQAGDAGSIDIEDGAGKTTTATKDDGNAQDKKAL